MVRLDKKTIELLESRNLELNNFTARISVECNGYSDDEKDHTTFEVTFHEEAEEIEQIGS
ncbi:hypothetical protein [Bacillus massiliigorillae]|uniref:hypothetical protein n=1 Tax=Bacillus massiliigorillae TaxID=1243664 RepID=UPI0003AB090E|nr:hypothetical protein [Bacillus massiliigorillae]